jgi:DNA-binding NarL/FixJ family response regulator
MCQADRAKARLAVERLDKFDADDGKWKESLVEDRKAGPAETAAARIDVAIWLKSLPHRDRQIAQVLACGETTGTTAKKFKLSDGRVSQLRRELEASWLQFQGECSAA